MRINLPKHLSDQRGVTFIELLVAMGLLAGFLVVLSTMLTSSVDTQLQTGAYASVTSDWRFALSRLAYDIRRASSVTTPASPGDSGSILVLSIGASTYTYSVNNGRLQLDIDGASGYLTSDKTVVSDLSFQKLGNSSGAESIRYAFTITGQADNRPDTQTYTSTTEVRP